MQKLPESSTSLGQESLDFLRSKSCLLEDRYLQRPFQRPGMDRHGNRAHTFLGHDDMAAGLALLRKSGFFKYPDKFWWPKCFDPPAHTLALPMPAISVGVLG